MKQSIRYHWNTSETRWVATEDRKIAVHNKQPRGYKPVIVWRPKFVVRSADALRERMGGRARPHAFVVPSQLRDDDVRVDYPHGQAESDLLTTLASGAVRGYGVRYDARYDRGWCAAWHDRCELDASTAANQPHHAYATLVSADYAMLWASGGVPVCIVYGPQWASIGSEYWRVSTKTVGKLKALADPHDGELYHSGADYHDVSVRHGLDEHQRRPLRTRSRADAIAGASDPLLSLLDAAIAQ